MKLRDWRIHVGLLHAICWLMPGMALAQVPGDALHWLQRVGISAEKLNYGGVFVYRSGNNSETSRITHWADGPREREVLEVLDGSPREVIRDNDETKCYLPESRLVVVERHAGRRGFPALLPGGVGALADYYAVRKGAIGRVAGYEAQLLEVEAKDDLRYSRQLWVDIRTGLLLKAVLLGDKGEPRETFAFTELKIGNSINKAALAAHFSGNAVAADWRVRNVKVSEPDEGDLSWRLRSSVPGYRLVSVMLRQSGPDAPKVTHMVLSDGLAAISVFVEPQQVPGKPLAANELATAGAMNVLRRNLGDSQVTVIGDAPPQALRRVADNLEARHK